MAQNDLQTAVDKQNVDIRTIAAANPEFHTFLSNLPELDGLVTIDVGGKNLVIGKIIVSRDFGLVIEHDNGYYSLVPKNAIKSIQFHPKNEEIKTIKDAEITPTPLVVTGAKKQCAWKS